MAGFHHEAIALLLQVLIQSSLLAAVKGAIRHLPRDRGQAGRPTLAWNIECTRLLNLVTRLPWEKFEILIYCMGTSRSFPFPFASHYALLITQTSIKNLTILLNKM